MASERGADSEALPEVYEDSAVTSALPTHREAPVQEEARAEDEVVLPAAVKRILQLRREEDDRSDDDLSGEGAGAAGRPPPPEGWSAALRQFSEEVRHMSKDAGRTQSQLEVRTFFDLQGYNLESFASKTGPEPGSLLLMYMFYSRIFEKVVGKQKGVEVQLFAPINFDDRLLGFRAILEWAKDFKMMPVRVPRRQLERIFVTCHAGNMPSHEKFASKITYPEFLTLVTFCGNTGEPMDLSRVDGSRFRENETRLEQVKRLATFLCLSNSKKVKLHLHNAYRDTHFWKLSDGADFQKEARAAEMRSRPHYEVGCLEIDAEITAAKKFLEKFTWTNPDNLWEEFEAPFLDMGASVLNQKSKRFKLQIINRALVLAKLSIQLSNTGPLRLPWKDCMVGPGQHVNVLIDTAPIECGEWRGAIRVLGSWAGFFGNVEGEVRIPTYFRVQTQQKDKDAGRTLPVHAPRPFRPGSANRIWIDPATLHPQQLRSPTPLRLRPASSSASSAKQESQGYRPGSSRTGVSTAVPSSRPLSALGPPSSRGCCSASAVPSSRSQAGRHVAAPLPPSAPQEAPRAPSRPRPRSAPSAPPIPKAEAKTRPASATEVR